MSTDDGLTDDKIMNARLQLDQDDPRPVFRRIKEHVLQRVLLDQPVLDQPVPDYQISHRRFIEHVLMSHLRDIQIDPQGDKDQRFIRIQVPGYPDEVRVYASRKLTDSQIALEESLPTPSELPPF